MKLFLAFLLVQFSFTVRAADSCAEATLSPQFCEAVQECSDAYAEQMGREPTTPEDLLKNPCKIAQEIYETHEPIRGYKKIGSCGLAPEEATALNFYAVSGYMCANQFLWKQNSELVHTKILVDRLTSGLAKLPKYKGFVRRGVSLPSSVSAKHVLGATVTYDAFTSSSTNVGFSSTDQLIIFSTTGRPIMGFSSLKSEAEVLFTARSKFKILDVKKAENGITYYTMKDVTEGDNPSQDKGILAAIKNQHKSSGVKDYDTYLCPFDAEAKVPKEILQSFVPALKAE